MKLVLCRGPPDMATIGFLGSSGKVGYFLEVFLKINIFLLKNSFCKVSIFEGNKEEMNVASYMNCSNLQTLGQMFSNL